MSWNEDMFRGQLLNILGDINETLKKLIPPETKEVTMKRSAEWAAKHSPAFNNTKNNE